MFRLLEIFVYDFCQDRDERPVFGRRDEKDVKMNFAMAFRLRIPPSLEQPLEHAEDSKNIQYSSTPGAISQRDALLFRSWVSKGPGIPVQYVDTDAGGPRLPVFPFPDDLFWTDSDEGREEAGMVAQWVDVDEMVE